jgi:hypothetical protein
MLRRIAAIVLLSMSFAPRAYGAEAQPVPPATKRKLPDYDGRGPKPTTVGGALLWVPRIVFSPIYLTTEYVLRRPIGAFLTWAERVNAFQSFYDFFAFGPDHKAGFAPIAFFDFGFNPSVGVLLFWDDAFAKGNNLTFHGTTWGSDWLAGVWTDRVATGKHSTFTFNTAAIRRPDHAYFGPGSQSLESNLGRYGETSFDSSVALDIKRKPIELNVAGGIRSADFFPGYGGIFYPNDPSIEKVAATGVYRLPDGFTTGYTGAYERLTLALDSRKPRPESQSGVRFVANAESVGDLRSGREWIHYGGTLAAFWDITGTARVLGLALDVAFADPLGAGPIPFTELVSLGGDMPMRGFLPGRLLGRSSAVLTASYRWPIWMWLDGTLQAAVGNVFDEHLENFHPHLFRFSGAVGLESSFSQTTSIDVLVGFGTETVERGLSVTSARFLIGSSRGF